MTNEEALEILKSIEILSFRDNKRKYFMRDVWKAQKVAIKALEQQPCEDYISRRAVKDKLMESWTKYMPMELDAHLSFVLEKISELPSVTPSYNSIKTELDCISRQDVLDVLKDKWNIFSDANDAMQESIDTIKALPLVTPQQTRWIPCSERLPEDGQDVLICDIDGDVMIGYHVRGRLATHFSQQGSYEHIKNVKAWQPLPQPYTESEDKE